MAMLGRIAVVKGGSWVVQSRRGCVEARSDWRAFLVWSALGRGVGGCDRTLGSTTCELCGSWATARLSVVPHGVANMWSRTTCVAYVKPY